jgi:hypothetical protein
MSVLLLAIIVTVFVMPVFFPYGDTRRLLAEILMSLILISGVAAVAEHPRAAIALAALSLAVILLSWMQWFVPVANIPGLRDVVAIGAFTVLAFAVGINVFASGHAIGDRVFGACVLYLLLGLIWAVAYHVVNTLHPGALTNHGADNSDLADWVYFSFVTLTTLGYGDITPVRQSARSLAILEALIGQLYPAVIIARLVSLQAGPR